MKKLLFFLFMFPVIVLSQEDLKKSAEDFILNYYKSIESLKWDKLTDLYYAEDAKIVLANGKMLPMRETIQANIERARGKVTNVKIDIKQVVVDVVGPNSVLVTTNGIDRREWSENIRVFDFFEIDLLERTDGVWKIKKHYYNINFPLTFAENIEEKYQRDNPPSIDKLGWAINNSWSLMLYEIERSTHSGITPAESGTIMGQRFAKTWDQSKGFEGMANGFNWAIQFMSKDVEVLERNETTIKARFIAPVTNDAWEVTSEDLIIFCGRMWCEIANYMGCSCTLSEDDKYWIVTFNKK